MARTFDPVPRLSVPRLVAGVFAGLVGGIAFGVLMIVPAVTGAGLEETGMMTLLGRLAGTQSLPVLWGIHLLASALFGLVFAAFVAPTRARRVLPFALAWGAILWLLGAFLVLRTLVGEPLVLDGDAAYNLLGHLAFGALLGLTYVAIFREEQGVLRDHPRVRARRPAPKP